MRGTTLGFEYLPRDHQGFNPVFVREEEEEGEDVERRCHQLAIISSVFQGIFPIRILLKFMSPVTEIFHYPILSVRL